MVQILLEGCLGEMISFDLYLKKLHERTQKPLWFLGFPNRYLFRFAMLVAEAEKSIIARNQHPYRMPLAGYGLFHGLKIARQLSIFTPVCALVPPFRVLPNKIKKEMTIRMDGHFLFWLRRQDSNLRPVAVPYIFCGGQSRLENIDRCHSLRSLHLPPAALPSLPSGNPEVDPKLATQAG
ncbi:MAG: hypothetical protein E7468_04645 [Ruminococcaceae bacterium]|nr:hypothetical protein [Oscillospiraceae bacterium]